MSATCESYIVINIVDACHAQVLSTIVLAVPYLLKENVRVEAPIEYAWKSPYLGTRLVRHLSLTV